MSLGRGIDARALRRRLRLLRRLRVQHLLEALHHPGHDLLGVTRIGEVGQGEGVAILDASGVAIDFTGATGWKHF